ncbi:MAG TPA: NAD(P)-dependent oxidoreductase [Firmicutes bacterium]|nr:NAD(P)-dependent oxidoreductase [Bacillota bacterium]
MIYTKLYLSDLEKVQNAIPNLKEFNKAKILITGAGGLIASALADLLIRLNDTGRVGNRIYLGARSVEKIKTRFGDRLERRDVIYLQYDALKSINTDESFDYIIHAASPASPTKYLKQPVETMLANFIGLNNLLEYAYKVGTKRILYVSSSEVYGKKENNLPYKETDYDFVDILNPRACYPSAKRAAETLCASYLAEYGVQSVIVRPGHIYGPTCTKEDSRASTQFFYNVIANQDIIMKSAGEQRRSYCYVLDCVSSIMTVLLNGKPGEAYNISNPDSIVTIRDLAEEIAKVSGKKVVFHIPSEDEVRGYNLMDNSSLNSDKIEGLGWKGLFDIHIGVEHTFRIMSQQG